MTSGSRIAIAVGVCFALVGVGVVGWEALGRADRLPIEESCLGAFGTAELCLEAAARTEEPRQPVAGPMDPQQIAEEEARAKRAARAGTYRERALALATAACDRGQARDCARLCGLQTEVARGAECRRAAVGMLRAGCARRDGLDCHLLAREKFEQEGPGREEVQAALEAAATLLKAGCERGDARACRVLGLETARRYIFGSSPFGYDLAAAKGYLARARTLMEERCAAGDAGACAERPLVPEAK